MKLKDLLQGINVLESTADMDMEITGIVRDTRKEIPAGSLFVAVSGFAFDGNRYLFANSRIASINGNPS